MIENERQYRITRTQAERFALSLTQMERGEDEIEAPSLHSLLRQAQTEALRSQLNSLREELADYETLRSGEWRTHSH